MSLLSLTLPLPDCGTRAEADAGDPADAATTTNVIAELRRQLAAPGMLAHPAVCRELRKLEEQLHGQLAADGRAPGRHRVPDQRGPDQRAQAPVPDHGPDEPPAAEGAPDEPDRAEPGRADAAGARAPQAARSR